MPAGAFVSGLMLLIVLVTIAFGAGLAVGVYLARRGNG